MGLGEAFHSGELQGADEHKLEHVRVQLPSSSLLSISSCPFRSSYPHRSSSTSLCLSGAAVGGEPGWSWTTVRRPHRGPRGGGPAREAARAPEAGPGSPAPRPARPNTQFAVHWKPGWGGSASGRPRMGGTGCDFGGKDGVYCRGGRRPEAYKRSDLL